MTSYFRLRISTRAKPVLARVYSRLWSLAELLLHNNTLEVLELDGTNIDTNGVLVLVETLKTNKGLRRLRLDKQHKQTCHSLPYYTTIGHRLVFTI